MQAGEKQHRMRAVFASLVVCVLLSHTMADEINQPPNPTFTDVRLQQKGSLTLRDVTLSQALFTISETWEVNLLFGKNVDGHVNAVFRDASLQEVLDSVLLANGFGYRPKGQSLIIMPLTELGDSNAMLQTISLEMPGNGGEDVMEAVRLLLSAQGKTQAMTSMGSIMVRDYPENITKIQALLRSIGGPSESQSTPFGTLDSVVKVLTPVQSTPFVNDRSIAYFSPRHTLASSMLETMQSFLNTNSKVVVIESENRIAVVGSAEELRLAKRIFDELDQPREQVRITALIYDVKVDEVERLGVNWSHNIKAVINSSGVAQQTFGGKFGPFPDPSAGAFSIGAAAVDAAAASTGTIGAARLTTLNRYFDLDTIINALDRTAGARLLADPSVTVLDREEASIKIVTEIPIQQLTQTSQGGSIGTTSFREAGVTLTVTPQIGGDGTITMQVTPTFSVLTGFSEGQPIIDSREATTKVRIANGQTLVLGGLRQRSENETLSGIPGLMRWKKLGKLFRDHDTTVSESELIVFLRPEITTPDTLGTARQAAALCVGEQALDKLNWPSQMPIVPDCKDPYCPYHNPRARFFNPQEVHSSLQFGDPNLQVPNAEPQQFLPPANHFPADGSRGMTTPSNNGLQIPEEAEEFPEALDLSTIGSDGGNASSQDQKAGSSGEPIFSKGSLEQINYIQHVPFGVSNAGYHPSWLQPIRPTVGSTRKRSK